MWRLLLTGLVVVALTGCSPTSVAGLKPDLKVGPADNGRAFLLQPGQAIEVDVPGAQSSDASVLVSAGSGRSSVTFRALGPGTALVTQPAPTAATPLRITVIVRLPGQHFDLVLTEKDQGHPAQLRVGQTVELVLAPNKGFAAWQGLQVQPAGILVQTAAPAVAVGGATVAAFRAAAPGQAVITAYAGPNCPPNAACAMIAAAIKFVIMVAQ